jgi:hypothetical protein
MTAYTAPSVTTTAPAVRKVAITHDPYRDDPYKGGQDLRRPSPPPTKVSITPSLRPTLKAVEKKVPSFLPGGGAFPGGGGGGGGGAPPTSGPVIDRAALDNILRDPNLDPADLEALATELEAEGFRSEATELRARAAQLRAMRPAPTPSPGVPREDRFVPLSPPLSPREHMEETAAASPGSIFTDHLPRPLVTLRGLWQAWRDYGNPFHGMASISGSATRSEGGRVRLIARLEHALELKNTEDVTWISVTPLGLDPFAQVSQTLTPYTLETGRAYEARFVSRTKKAPSRGAVLRLLRSMGFSPISLSAVKRDMRFPGRPGANLVLWHGVVRWDGPPSIIVADDPLYFSEMRVLSTIDNLRST